MTLHPHVLSELLDDEVELARAALGVRAGDLHRDGLALLMTLVRPDGSWILRLDGREFDAEPYDVALVDEAGVVLPIERWMQGLAHSMHPVLGVPWICISGTKAYYTWPGHNGERWDTNRRQLRADSLINHILEKADL